MPVLYGPARRLAIRFARHKARVSLRAKGYSRKQAARLVAGVDDKTFLDKLKEFWAKYGATVLAILQAVMAIVSALVMTEAPDGQPLTADQLVAVEAEEAEEEVSAP